MRLFHLCVGLSSVLFFGGLTVWAFVAGAEWVVCLLGIGITSCFSAAAAAEVWWFLYPPSAAAIFVSQEIGGSR